VATRKRTGVLAGAAALALLAFPGIANAAVTSNVNTGALTVTSDAADPIAITAVGGKVKVNGADPGTGAVNAADITSITVTGDAGANTIDLSGVTVAAYPAITAVTVSGGGGVDTITGSEHADRLVGGDNDDDVSGIAGNDTIVWNPGDDSDRNEGGAGSDTIEVNGGNGPETFTVKPSATAGRVQFDRALPTPTPPGLFSLDIGTSERLDMNMNGGDDSFTADAGLDALGFALDVDGGAGNDAIDGGDGADLLKGGDGDDRIVPDDNPPGPTGARDDARGDAGNDTIVWNGGDDNDLNEGGDGVDTIEVNGAAANETFTVKPSAMPGRILFDRAEPTPNPPGLFSIDIGTAERLDLNMNAGNDTLITDPGLPAFKIDAEGGDGNDAIDGGDAADLLSGGNGDDRIVPDDNPDGTVDVARGDAGNDTIVWNGGDDNDTNDGGDGEDTSEVNGAPAGERFTVKPSATAGRVQFDRVSTNPAPFSIDIGTTARLLLNAAGGNDSIDTRKGLAGLIKGEFNGGDGNDSIEGTDAADRLNGDKGNDVINSRDKAEDLVDCGAGFDLAFVDRRDFLRNCNLVLGGHLRVKVGAKKVAVAGDVAALPLNCAGTKRCKGTVRLRDAGKTLGSAKFNITKRSKTVQLKLNGKGRRLLAGAPAKGESVSVQIDARDANGNGWRTTKKVTLTR
jgi:Ca2+-binding RTX toxin-like protein